MNYNKLYFLGFSFHKLTLIALKDKLEFKDTPPPETYTSSFKMKDGEIIRATNQLKELCFPNDSHNLLLAINNQKNYHDLTIPELFKTNSRFSYV